MKKRISFLATMIILVVFLAGCGLPQDPETKISWTEDKIFISGNEEMDLIVNITFEDGLMKSTVQQKVTIEKDQGKTITAEEITGKKDAKISKAEIEKITWSEQSLFWLLSIAIALIIIALLALISAILH